MKDWTLTPCKKWLIMGDSNACRIPPFQEPDLQIESYPGATFRHAEAILAKTIHTDLVETLILSFGINNRIQRTDEAGVVQLQRAVRMAEIAFPKALVLIPELNFSESLPEDEQQNLMRLNHHIVSHFNSIPKLLEKDFVAEQDGIHWTIPTARNILHHWVEMLKENAP